MLTDAQIAENFNRLVEKIEQDITGPHKCSVMGVFPTENDPGVPFNYTIGLSDMGWPELIVAGLSNQIAGRLLNNVVDRCLTDLGAPVAGVVVHDVGNYPIRFTALSEAQRDEYMRWAVARQERVNGPEPQALQVQFPDPDGRWPDDPACEPRTAFVQELPTVAQRERVQ